MSLVVRKKTKWPESDEIRQKQHPYLTNFCFLNIRNCRYRRFSSQK